MWKPKAQVEMEVKASKKKDTKVPVPVEVKEVKEEKVEDKHEYVVVKELPLQQVREVVTEDGTIVHYITTEEALSQLMNQ